MTTWDKLRKELEISEEDEQVIQIEKRLIETLVKIREEKGITQTELAELCGVKQPVIARLEKAVHSPQLDSLLRVLVPMGYSLQIVPITKNVNISMDRQM